MRGSIKKEFGSRRPRAIVLDDRKASRKMIARHLKSRGFDVAECASVPAFLQLWMPGTADVIVADWQLSSKPMENGDRVLEQVRERDWDVPFVLVSGKLVEDTDRARVLARLLESGGARFVRRGSSGIRKIGDESEDLMERRDLALVKMILALRESALNGDSIPTTSGGQSAAQLLEDIVSRPAASHDAGRPVAQAISRKRTPGPS